MTPIRSLQRIITEGLPTASAIIAGAGVLVLVTIVSVGVVARYLFNRPLLFGDEYAGYLMALITVVGASYVLKNNAHISCDFLSSQLPRRSELQLRLVTNLLSFACAVFLCIHTARMTISAFEQGTVAVSPMATPLGPVYLIMPIGFALLAIQMAVETVNVARAVFSETVAAELAAATKRTLTES